jgi:hypothetical protein
VLKPGGELRLSGPRKDTSSRIANELKEGGTFPQLEPDYMQVLQINELKLRPMLYWRSMKEVADMLIGAKFSKIVHYSEVIYAGQSMFVCAVK